MTSDSSGGFRQGYHTFLYGNIKYNREGGRKNKRTNTDLGQLQEQEREFCDTLHSPCIYRLSPACILRETSAKATRNANSSLSSLTASFCWLSLPWTAISRRLVSFALRSRVPLTVPLLSTAPLSSLGPSFPLSLPVSREVSLSVLCVGFAPKQTKRFSDRRAHTHPTQWMTT